MLLEACHIVFTCIPPVTRILHCLLFPLSPISLTYVDVVLIPLTGLSDVACPLFTLTQHPLYFLYAFPCPFVNFTCVLQSHLHILVRDPSDVPIRSPKPHVNSFYISPSVTHCSIITQSWYGAIPL